MESTSTKDEVPCFCDIIVFGRLPRPGRVKTRLAASIGPEAACAFYKACAEHIILTACLRYNYTIRCTGIYVDDQLRMTA